MVCLSDEQFLLIARALSDPIRYRILNLISREDRAGPARCCSIEMCVCDIQEALNMQQSKVSYHLKELKNAGLLREQKRGKWHFYAVNQETLKRFCRELSDRFSLNSFDDTETVKSKWAVIGPSRKQKERVLAEFETSTIEGSPILLEEKLKTR